jgi:Mce-associated membrane protein
MRLRAIVVRAARAASRSRALPWVLAGVFIVVSAGAGTLGYLVRQRNLAEQRDQHILAAARQEALNFTSIDYQHFDRDSQDVVAGATGDFKQQFSDQLKALHDLVTANKAVSAGQVLQAGIVTADEHSARVLVVADSKVVNTAAPGGQVRNYRLQMDLVDQAGRWLASSIEFVG